MPYFVIGLLILAFRVVHGNLVLPSYFSSSMVLQQNEDVEFWGISSSPQEHIAVTFDTKEFDTIADDNGKFQVILPGRPASLTTYTITVQEKGVNSTTTLHDIVFGEVYVCSGQSNMQLGVSATFNQAEEIAKSSTHGKGLRIMLVESAPEYYNISTPQENVSLSLPWGHPSPSRYTQKDGSEFVPVAGMSAVCYYYGVEMTKKNTSIPVGLIASSWGGTRIQVWMDQMTLKSCGGVSKAHENPSKPVFEAESFLMNTLIDLGVGPPNMDATLWNSMIFPFLKLKLSGILWYQGESNSNEPELYSRCFPAMISQWRQYWNAPNLPFLFVQISAWPNHDAGIITGIRYAQLSALKLDFVEMVVAADIADPAGSYHPIHPPWKQEVGRRLALLGDKLCRGETNIPGAGPNVVNVVFDPWNLSWGNYHHGVASGICQTTTTTGWYCGGIRVKFDQKITLRSPYGLQYGMGDGGGFSLWNDVSGEGIPGATSAGSRQLKSNACLDCSKCPCSQPLEVVGVLEDGYTLQLNTTFVSGKIGYLKYAFKDYPTMIVYDTVYGRPARPFNLSLSV
jgi:sialate O-acetylesterase